MKNIICLGLLCTSLVASAAELEITRFAAVTENRRVAELCGKAPANRMIQAIVDYNSSAAVSYTIPSDASGNFCGLVATFYGRVQVRLDEKTQKALLSENFRFKSETE